MWMSFAFVKIFLGVAGSVRVWKDLLRRSPEMASLTWSLKAWFALWLPESGRWSREHQAEKKAVLRMSA